MCFDKSSLVAKRVMFCDGNTNYRMGLTLITIELSWILENAFKKVIPTGGIQGPEDK